MALSQMHKDYRIRAGESRSTTTEEDVLRFEIHQEGCYAPHLIAHSSGVPTGNQASKFDV